MLAHILGRQMDRVIALAVAVRLAYPQRTIGLAVSPARGEVFAQLASISVKPDQAQLA